MGIWDFALAVYAAPGVEALCLKARDRFGIDIDMMLYAAWLDWRGMRVEPGAAAGAAAPWRRVIEPLRAARRAAKAMGEAELAKALLAQELRAERGELEALAALPVEPAGTPAPLAELGRVLGAAAVALDLAPLEEAVRRLAPARSD